MDISKVQGLIKDAVRQLDGILPDKPVDVWFTAVGQNLQRPLAQELHANLFQDLDALLVYLLPLVFGQDLTLYPHAHFSLCAFDLALIPLSGQRSILPVVSSRGLSWSPFIASPE
jgi:hypothetical protein